MLQIVLYFIAKILYIVISPIVMTFSIIRLIFVGGLSKYFYYLALAIDQLGNVMIAPIANKLLIKKESINLFGNPNETISYVLGVNYVKKTLSSFGYFIAHTLDVIDKNHVINSSNTEQKYK